MAPRGKGGLGKGLDALIPAAKTANKTANESGNSIVADAKEGESIVKVKWSKVSPNRDQPRKNFNEDELQELADSIKQFGIQNPIIVQDRKDYYEIVAGERRWRAAQIAGLKEVPVVIRNYTEQELAIIAILDNTQRADLNEIEEAQGFKKLIDTFNMTQDEVAEKLSMSRTAVTNKIRLLKLSKEVQQMIIDERINGGAARALIAITDEAKQIELAETISRENLNVRQVEKLVKEINKDTKPSKKQPKSDEKLEIIYREYEEKLKKSVGTKVAITSKGDGSGKLEIDFYNHDDLDRITALLTK